jgi:hypothetical protein
MIQGRNHMIRTSDDNKREKIDFEQTYNQEFILPRIVKTGNENRMNATTGNVRGSLNMEK